VDMKSWKRTRMSLHDRVVREQRRWPTPGSARVGRSATVIYPTGYTTH
jgi:hypothetical protein